MPKFDAQKQSQTVFSLWVDDVQTAYDALLQDVQAEITRMRVLGMTDESIFYRLTSELDSGTGIFSSFNGWVEGGTDKLVNTISQLESNTAIAVAGGLYIWELDPTAEHCEDCLMNADKEAQSFDEWEATGLPGAGNTACDGYCKCTLLKAA